MKNRLKVGLVSVRRDDGFPPSSLVYLGSYLKKHFGNDIDLMVIDGNFVDPAQAIRSEKFDLLGISAMTIYYGKALRLAEAIKKEIDTPIMIGGVHISTLPESFEGCFDAGIIGEGEETVSEVISFCLAKGFPTKAELYGIKGVIFRDGPNVIKTEERPLIGTLDDIPLPDWSLVNRSYFSNTALNTWGEFGVEGNILTSRGCPYKCVFCSTTQFWQKMRFHSAEYVLEQVKDLADNYGVTHIQIWDDLFTINKPRLIKIAGLLNKSGLLKRVKFDCQPRANLVDDELCEILKSMNVSIAMFGFESGSDKVLKFLKCGSVTVEDNRRAVTLCGKHGIKVQGSLMLASPGETLEDMRKTLDFVDFALKNKAQRLWSFVLTPFPGTEVWEIAKQRGKVRDKGFDWDSLSHQNLDNPLLLDEGIDLGEFKKTFLDIRKKTIGFRWRKVASFILDNPFKAFVFMLKNPFHSIYLLFTRKDV